MILSCHQPHYLPWLGYFDKIDKSDVFIFLDNVQYKKRELQNRNRIRTSRGWKWLTVPVITKKLFLQRIKDVQIDNSRDWQESHLGQIKASYSKSDHFEEYEDFFIRAYSQNWQKLIDLNVCIISYILGKLGIKKKIYFESQLGFQAEGTQRIIKICKALGADTYLSGVGGKNYLDERRFKEENIELIYQDFRHPEYKQRFDPFIINMSIIDLLFNHGKESLNILNGGSNEHIGHRRTS